MAKCGAVVYASRNTVNKAQTPPYMKRGSCISPLRPDKEHAILEFLLFYVYTTAIIIQSVFNKYKIKSFEVSIMWFGVIVEEWKGIRTVFVDV